MQRQGFLFQIRQPRQSFLWHIQISQFYYVLVIFDNLNIGALSSVSRQKRRWQRGKKDVRKKMAQNKSDLGLLKKFYFCPVAYHNYRFT